MHKFEEDKPDKMEIAAYSFEATHSPSPTTVVPITVTSGMFICVWYSAATAGIIRPSEAPSPASASASIGCGAAERVFVVVTSETESKFGFTQKFKKSGQKWSDKSREDRVVELKSSAASTLQKAIRKGYAALKGSHTSSFGERMRRVELHLDSVNETHTCASSLREDRLDSFNRGCLLITEQDELSEGRGRGSGGARQSIDGNGQSKEGGKVSEVVESVDVRLLSSAYQYGRYLLLSTGTGAVSNLQGLWADGDA
jgi:hypothetical protein